MITDERFDELMELVVHGFEIAGVVVLVLGLIVIVRTFLSFSLEVELEGTLPWRRRPTRDRPTAALQD